MIDAKAVIRKLAAKKSQRSHHEPIWQECFDYSYPERGNGLNSSSMTPQDGQTKKNRILDDTAADSARVLSSGIASGTTPPSSLWFGLDAGQESDEENAWLDESARILFENIHGANFDAAAFECCIDLVAAGWFVLYIDEAKGGGFAFEQWPLSECYISSSKLGGLIDTVYREVDMTVEQVVNAYGLDKVSNKVAENYRNEKFDEKVKIVHAIEPRRMYAVGGKLAKNLPFSSCHLEVATEHVLRESGYHEFPCAIPRWMLITGTPYPTGPMAQALGSIRTINDIKALELANLDMAVAGMWIAEDDGVLNPKTVKVGPRKIIVANSVESMKQLTSGTKFDVAFSAEDRLQASIRKTLLADQLQPQDGPAMTATEVHARVNLIRQLLGPIYGRLQAEYLQPLITRCFGIAYRAGVLGQAPESLQDRAFSVKYLGPLARAQRLEDVTAMDRFEQTLMMEAQADQTVLDVYDFELAARERSKYLGVPQSLLRTNDKVDALRDSRKKQQQQQQQQSMQQQVATDAMGAIANKVAA